MTYIITETVGSRTVSRPVQGKRALKIALRNAKKAGRKATYTIQEVRNV